MVAIVPVRGRIYLADLGYGQKAFLVVSNNARNRTLNDCIAVRITTSRKQPMPTVVELSSDDPLEGRVLCDDITPMYRDEVRRDVGALSVATMTRVGQGLRVALAL